jgi:hypothetical protein
MSCVARGGGLAKGLARAERGAYTDTAAGRCPTLGVRREPSPCRS